MYAIGQFAAEGFERSWRAMGGAGGGRDSRSDVAPSGRMAHRSASYPYLGNGVYPDAPDHRQILIDRGVPFVETPDRQLFFASIGREGGYALVPGAEVVRLKSYLDVAGELQTCARDEFFRLPLPANVNSADVDELRFGHFAMGRDYDVPEEWVDAILDQGVTAGDPAESLRRQVAVDAVRYPQLARFVDPGTGQINPLQWRVFLNEARSLGLPMLVSSNGIGNFYQQARDNIRLLAEGSNVLAVNVYNPTIDGGFLADAWNESLPSLMGYKQTVQVAIECELRAALAYNRELGEVHGGASPVLTQFVGHSQGTIHGNLAVDGLHAEEKERITVVNIGAASRHLPRGLIGFVSIVDKGDPVVRLTASHRIAGQVCEQERKDTYRLVETDISSTVGAANAGNQHSFYLYAQTEQFQRELAFVERPQPVVISRPFIPGFNWWANQLGRSYVRSANTPDRGGVR